MNWDVFISHASEDKENFVIPLANKLKEYGVNVWLDKFTLKPGDSLRRSIDRGLRESKYGIVIISNNFLNKNWPEYELDSLINRQVEGQNVIIPIWYNITKKQIQEYSFYLADKIALVANNMNLDEISKSVIGVIRPDIYSIIENINRTDEMYEFGKIKKVDVAYLNKTINGIMKNKSNRKHEELTLDIMVPLRLIHSIYKDTDNISYEKRVEIYKYNTNPQREILIEIKNATIFLENTINKNYSISKRKSILGLINSLSFDKELEYEDLGRMNLTKEEFVDIKNSFNNFNPNMDQINSQMIIITKNK